MQTTKWGPEGWMLFHSIPFFYPKCNAGKATQARFKKLYSLFEELLPCKYCRISYAQYWKELDIDSFLTKGRKKLFEWTYHLHNLVNKKLRDQGYLNKPDPSFDCVWKRYQKKLVPELGGGKDKIIDPNFWGPATWNFIGTIAFNYTDSPKMREAHSEFLYLLGDILRPTEQYRQLLVDLPPELGLHSREDFTSWLHLFREILNERLGKVGRKYYPSYKQFHNRYEARRAKCAKKTCRVPVNSAQRGAKGICRI